MIQVQKMSYSYDKNVPVLEDITLMEQEPVIMGLWGRNGAGKTTLMKLLAGHLRPSQGIVTIMGEEPYNNEQAAKSVCYLQEEHPFGHLWTVQDALLFGSLFNPDWHQDTAEKLLGLFKLEKRKKVNKLSKGMKSSLQFIIGLASHAAITILDEPINGLDAGMRKTLYEAVLESHGEFPRLIMISTHHIEEFQGLFESLVVLKDGKLLFHEPMDDIRIKGVWLTGNRNKLKEVMAGQRVLEKSEVGSLVKVMLDAPFSYEWKATARAGNLAIEKAKMQDYLLSITKNLEVPV